MSINRRKVLGGAGLAGAAAATGAGVDRLISDGTSGYPTDKVEPMTDDAARFGNPRLPSETITSRSHLFPLGAQPISKYDGGSFQQASEDNFPILKGQEASVLLLTLQPGGIREPHWHPSAWEINIVIKGVAAWVIIQNTSAPEDKDNIGIGESLSRLPPRVLSAVFGVPAETFNSFKKIDNAVTIVRSP
jgi:oxalate decarboxylase